MYPIGHSVFHRIHGVCRILDTTTLDNKPYYKLAPLSNLKLTLFVPVESTQIRELITKKQACDLLTFMNGVDEVILSDARVTKDAYGKKLNTGNPTDLAFLTKKYLVSQRTLAQSGHVNASAIKILDTASQMFVAECAVVFDQTALECMSYLKANVHFGS